MAHERPSWTDRAPIYAVIAKSGGTREMGVVEYRDGNGVKSAVSVDAIGLSLDRP